MSNENRRQNDVALFNILKSLEEERQRNREIIESLHDTIKDFMTGVNSEDHRKSHEYLDLVIQKEKEKAAMRRAVIEKTLGSLLWVIIVGMAVTVGHYLFPNRW